MLLVIITLITLFVLGLLTFVILRYNQKANKEPARFTHNSPLEVAWTVVPLRWAMEPSVSPLRTTWVPEAAMAKTPTVISATMSRGRSGARTCNCLLRSPPARK